MSFTYRCLLTLVELLESQFSHIQQGEVTYCHKNLIKDSARKGPCKMSETEKTPVSIKLCILSSSTNIFLEVELPHLGLLRVDSCFAAQESFQAGSGTTGLE